MADDIAASSATLSKMSKKLRNICITAVERMRRHKDKSLVVEENLWPLMSLISDIKESDEWRAYRVLPELGYNHFTVNHSQWYVDPVTGTHTQHIERAWRKIKEQISKTKEMVLDFQRATSSRPITIQKAEVEVVSLYKYLGHQMDDKLN
ncbi:hypothetical protein WMY93_008548 [Mugilogobius chulae]|uniref:ISXO2-like transposase domain-containing protein n=1 Tax=Mugilogobius chulae TaxID=88201 RepID=A0AAW0PGM0_9GOBI